MGVVLMPCVCFLCQVIVQTQVGFIIDCVQTSVGPPVLFGLLDWPSYSLTYCDEFFLARMLSFVACLVYVAGTYLGNHPTPPGTLFRTC